MLRAWLQSDKIEARLLTRLSIIDFDKAASVLRDNDRGGYTVPTHGLYPFQWSWDSAITALGWQRIDEDRAWQEAATMFRGQWANGMLPHILFHQEAGSYFPGPDVWGGGQAIPSSAISQPPIWATALRRLHETSGDATASAAHLNELVPKLLAYHLWWYQERDPEGTGLVCSYHPWESGMDNSPAWDEPLRNVPTVDWSYQRRDLTHVDSDQRPKKPEYDRYLFLVDFYKRHNFDSDYIYSHCPYKVLDVGIISMLHRASEDLLWLCEQIGCADDVETIRKHLQSTQAAIGKLWSEDKRCFLSHDLVTNLPLDEVTTATVLPLLGGLADEQQARAMTALIGEWLDATAFGLSSTHPSSACYEPQRYWRGPVWLHINWLIALGLERYGEQALAARLRESAKDCVRASGLWEYYNAERGNGCGGDNFSWTAAIALHWLDL